MPTPFPGMDPYLERPSLGHGIHNRLIATIADLLGPLLRPRYFVAVEERSYLDDPVPASFTTVPDVGVIGPYSSQPVAVLEAPISVTEPHVIELPMPEQIRETYLSIQEVRSSDIATEMWLEGEDGLKVVTILEILSPWYNGSREGRAQYTRKREEVINSFTNLVEIDLLRAGLCADSGGEAPLQYLCQRCSDATPRPFLSLHGAATNSYISVTAASR